MTTLKRILNRVIMFIQKIAVTAGLFVIYIVGFGLTAAAARMTGAIKCDGRIAPGSWWQKADGYDNDPQESERES